MEISKELSNRPEKEGLNFFYTLVATTPLTVVFLVLLLKVIAFSTSIDLTEL